jgi:hypothetical protein
VRSIPLLVALLAVAVTPAAAVGAGPAGFSDPVAIGFGAAARTAGAVGADGTAALAWTGFTREGATLRAALRAGAAGPWRTSALSVDASDIRDPQLVVTPDGDVVLAWAEIAGRGRRHDVALSAAPAGGDFGAVRRIAVGNGFSAFPRLVVLRSGAVLLAFRDAPLPRRMARLRVAVRSAAGDRFGAPGTVATRVTSLALAATGDGALLAWSTPAPRPRADRTLFAQRLDGRGRPTGGALTVARAAGSEVRLAGSADGRAMVSWVRPRRPGRPLALFTRELERSLARARPLLSPVGIVFGGAGAVTMGISGRALAAATALGPGGVRVFAARSAFGAAWSDLQELSIQPAPVVGDPRPVLLPSGEALVAWTQPRAQPGEPVYDVLVAQRPAGQVAFAAPQPLTANLPGGQANGLLAATDGGRVLVAWAAPGGGLLAVERG